MKYLRERNSVETEEPRSVFVTPAFVGTAFAFGMFGVVTGVWEVLLADLQSTLTISTGGFGAALTSGVAIGLGTMIPIGIFLLSGIGSTAVIPFILAAIVADHTAVSYSEFASIYSENGGGYLFTSRTLTDRDVLAERCQSR